METLGTSLLTPFGSGMQSAWSVLVSPLQAVVGFFAPWRESHSVIDRAPQRASSRHASNPMVVRHGVVAANCQQFHPGHRESMGGNSPAATVRVLRVVDASCTTHSAGRMRISGRFSDVCAELDRLSQQEAA